MSFFRRLIRKEWPEDAFATFCDILKETQNDQLVTLVVKKADVLLAGRYSKPQITIGQEIIE